MSEIKVVYGLTEFFTDEDGARQIAAAVDQCLDNNTSAVLNIIDPSSRVIRLLIGPNIPILIESPTKL